MWIAISGATGSGKHVIGDYLVQDGYEQVAIHTEKKLPEQLLTFSDRLWEYYCATDRIARYDIFTIRSIWEAFLIQIPLAFEFHLISPEQYETLMMVKAAMFSRPYSLQPPSAMIFVRSNKMATVNRLALRGKLFDQNMIFREMEMYEDFISTISIPILEIDATQDVLTIKKNVSFGMASFKAPGVASNSVWQKGMFR